MSLSLHGCHLVPGSVSGRKWRGILLPIFPSLPTHGERREIVDFNSQAPGTNEISALLLDDDGVERRGLEAAAATRALERGLQLPHHVLPDPRAVHCLRHVDV